MYGNTHLKRFTYIFGISMALIMALTVILPAFTPNTQLTQPVTQPTDVPPATVPPPPDIASITFDATYMHPSGMYTVAEPDGWLPSAPTTTDNSVRTTFSNTPAQSIIQVDVEKPQTDEGLTLDDVDAQFTTSALASSWSRYSSWSETGERRRENDRLIMDFVLGSNNQIYIARQEAWTDGALIYSVRVVTPENARDVLLYVLDGMTNSLTLNTEFAGTPLGWNAYFDTADHHIIRYPQGWTLQDSAPGRPTTIGGGDGIVLRVETVVGSVSDAEAASAWVEALRAGTTVESVEPVTRDEFEGFSVAYTAQTADGERESGLVVLLNDADDTLHIANLRFPEANVDLNSETALVDYSDLVTVIDTFYVMPDVTIGSEEESAS